MQCSYPAHNDDRNGVIRTYWHASSLRMHAVADPWLFADDCTEQLCAILEGTGFYDAKQDIFTSGLRFVTRTELAGSIAFAVRDIQAVPQSVPEFIGHYAVVANIVAGGVSGSKPLPAIAFSAP